ncbi:MAG TPA: histidine phosphatase family protein [Pyrinomonadaceae bacterium]|nr:histidine phosphatase family protein [Pyrinomonadaceae bacterium]
MKTLYVLRHAKSSWDDPNISDFDRPLNDRGERTAPFMGQLMRDRGLIPEAVISSPARRATETASLVRTAAGIEPEIRFDERIYEASPQALRQVASEADNSSESIMLVGHNPGIEGFIRMLTGETVAAPTAALAVIVLDISAWADIAPGSGRLEALIRPKEVKRTFSTGS